MKDKLQKLKDTVESIPKYLVTQKVVFPIYQFDLNGQLDAASIVSRALPFRKSNIETSKPDIVQDGYQTTYIEESDPTLFLDLNKLIEDKCRSIFKQNYKATNYWFIFYERGSEVLSHSHYNLKSFYAGSKKFQIYPLSVAYYPLCSDKSSPIIFTNEHGTDVEIKVKQNTLLIFNSNLVHYVPKSTENNLRLVYSCNLYQKD